MGIKLELHTKDVGAVLLSQRLVLAGQGGSNRLHPVVGLGELADRRASQRDGHPGARRLGAAELRLAASALPDTVMCGLLLVDLVEIHGLRGSEMIMLDSTRRPSRVQAPGRAYLRGTPPV